MKKTLVALVAVLLVASMATLVAAETELGNGSLNVFGKIGAGAISFTVDPVTYSRIDLINNTAVQPAGEGVGIGSWTMSGSNQAAAVDYQVSYTFNPLTIGNDGSTNPIAYQVLVINGTNVTEIATAGRTSFTASAGNPSVSRNIAVRLTTAGATAAASAPASENYGSTIVIALILP